MSVVALDRFHLGTRWHRHCNERRYDAPADPWKRVWVDPSAVDRYDVVSLEWGVGAVMDGEWDRPENTGHVRETATYESLRRRFEEGVDWERTRLYDRARERFDAGETVRGCSDLEAYRTKRLAAVDDLYDRMREDGYRPNYEHVYDDPRRVESVHDFEPMVLVGRDGEPLWSEGFHRHALADLLDVEVIPVYVLRRHVEWQRVRDAVAEPPAAEPAPELAAHVDHPDLRDVVD